MYHERYWLYSIPAAPLTSEILSAALTDAVKKRDLNRARDLFNITLRNEELTLVPDWYQLLAAVATEDKGMTRLLITWRGKWTENEASALKELFSDRWPAFTTNLRLCGLAMTDLSIPSDAKTAARMAMRILNEEHGPLHEEIIKALETKSTVAFAFNSEVSYARFSKLKGKDLTENLAAIAEASRKGYYQATRDQFEVILRLLDNKYESGALPEDVKSSIRFLKEGNPELYVNMFYLGRKEPGLAKLLYDIDAVPSDCWSPKDMIARLQDNLKISPLLSDLYRLEKHDKNTEFLFQLYVEQKKPELIAQRGNITSYHEVFKTLFFDAPPQDHKPFRATRHTHWPRY